MVTLSDPFWAVLVLVNLILLGSARVRSAIRCVGFQGLVLGFLPFIKTPPEFTPRIVLFALISTILKGFVFPSLMARTLKDSSPALDRESRPYVGHSLSLMFGILAFALSLWIAGTFPLEDPLEASTAVPVALFTMGTGFFLIITRKNALSQVVGYLVLENGIYIFGVSLALETPFLVELGVLLDLFVAVFVMGIMMFHIQREFDNLDTNLLTKLKDE